MIAVVTAVNVWGTRKSSDLQNWTTLIKAGIIVVLSAVLLSLGTTLVKFPPRSAQRNPASLCYRVSASP